MIPGVFGKSRGSLVNIRDAKRHTVANIEWNESFIQGSCHFFRSFFDPLKPIFLICDNLVSSQAKQIYEVIFKKCSTASMFYNLLFFTSYLSRWGLTIFNCTGVPPSKFFLHMILKTFRIKKKQKLKSVTEPFKRRIILSIFELSRSQAGQKCLTFLAFIT